GFASEIARANSRMCPASTGKRFAAIPTPWAPALTVLRWLDARPHFCGSGSARCGTIGPVQTHFGAIWEAIADAVPDARAVVQGARRFDWRTYEQRAARLAAALLDAGLRPHSKVAMYLYNSPEYCEANFAAIKIRGVPINVNYRYLDRELTYLLDNSDA